MPLPSASSDPENPLHPPLHTGALRRLSLATGRVHLRHWKGASQACAGHQYVRRGFPVSLAPSVSAQPCGVRLRLHRPRPPCGPANTAGPQWLYGTKGPPASPVGPVPTSYYAPSLRYPWRAALEQEDLDRIRTSYQRLARHARANLRRGKVDTGIPELDD